MKSSSISLTSGMASEAHPASPTAGLASVVLIHGAGGSRLSWPPGVRRLEGVRTLAIDLTGHGGSPPAGQQASISAYAAALNDWMDAVHLERAVLVGHSMGGAIALWMALETPSRVLGLGLLGTAAVLKVHPALLAAASSPETSPQAIQRIVHWSFSPEAPARLKELTARRMAETPPAVLYSDLLACDRFSLEDRLNEVQVPALVLCGSQDKMTPPEQSRRLAEALPDARLEILQGAGHMLMQEQPQSVASHLAQFAAVVAT